MKKNLLLMLLFSINAMVEAQILTSLPGYTPQYELPFPSPKMSNNGQLIQFNYVDSLGKEIIAGTFQEATGFTIYGIALAKQGAWGVIDLKGNFVIPPQYSYLEVSRNGYILAALGGTAGLIPIIDCTGARKVYGLI